jgi:peptidoglycan hydrolase-like protein with peptidoglycan-binding domain
VKNFYIFNKKGLFYVVVICTTFALCTFKTFAQTYGSSNYGDNPYGENSLPSPSISPSPSPSPSSSPSPSPSPSPSSSPSSIGPQYGSYSVQSILRQTQARSTGQSNNSLNISKLSNTTRNLTISTKGDDVKDLQRFLIYKNYLEPGNDTGYYGKFTSASVKLYQISLGIKPTGTLGPLTRSAIEKEINGGKSSNKFSTPLSLGLSHTEVRKLQEVLGTLPDIYPEQKVTGYYGPLTKKAVEKFQLEYKIVSSKTEPGFGKVGPKTREKLNELTATSSER